MRKAESREQGWEQQSTLSHSQGRATAFEGPSMRSNALFDSLLEAPPPSVSCSEAQEVVSSYFGLDATATAMAGERDANFRIDILGGQTLLLKVTSAHENRAVTNMQTQALHYLNRRCSRLRVPNVIQARNGAFELLLPFGRGTHHVTRLMSFLPGRPVSALPRSERLSCAAVRALAELDSGLRGFEHPAAKHDLLWDVSRAGRVRPLLEEGITSRSTRDIALEILDSYQADIVVPLQALRAQVIHNDLNPHNILAMGAGSLPLGIIDFGDMIHAPLIADLATAASYQLVDVADPLTALCALVAEYHAVLPLEPEELGVLVGLVAARLVLLLAISGWRARAHPANQAYILRNTHGAAQCLTALAGLSRAQAIRRLLQACRI